MWGVYLSLFFCFTTWHNQPHNSTDDFLFFPKSLVLTCLIYFRFYPFISAYQNPTINRSTQILSSKLCFLLYLQTKYWHTSLFFLIVHNISSHLCNTTIVLFMCFLFDQFCRNILFVYLLSIIAFKQQLQRLVVAASIIWLVNLNYFLSGSLRLMFAELCTLTSIHPSRLRNYFNFLYITLP